MTLPRALAIVSVLVLAGMPAALAQFPPPPNPSANPFPPAPGAPAQPARPLASQPASPFPVPGQAAPTGRNPCEAFLPLRAAAEKDAQAIQAAGKRKAPREEVCPLFKWFAATEAKMVKFLKDHQSQCGVPANAVKQAGLNHNKTIQIRNQVCAAGPAPSAPRLSDAFSTPLGPGARPDRGTFDTLTGNPLRQ